jgi:hypothetical protein
MMFRDMMRCVGGVCCAAVMVCGMDVTGMNGRNVTDWNVIKKNDTHFDGVSFTSLSVNFPVFLGSSASAIPSEWPRALDDISEEVSALQLEQYAHCWPSAYAAINRMSHFAFKDLVAFCESSFCALSHRATLLSLISLVPNVLGKFSVPADEDTIFIYNLPSSSDMEKLICDFNIFLTKIPPSPFPIVSISDASVFQRVSDTLWKLINWNKN